MVTCRSAWIRTDAATIIGDLEGHRWIDGEVRSEAAAGAIEACQLVAAKLKR